MKKLFLITMMLLIASCSSTTGLFKQYPTEFIEIKGIPLFIVQSIKDVNVYKIEIDTDEYGVINLITTKIPKPKVKQTFKVKITYWYDGIRFKSFSEIL